MYFILPKDEFKLQKRYIHILQNVIDSGSDSGSKYLSAQLYGTEAELEYNMVGETPVYAE
jgi:hypothetical protein